jgi:iron-sulfur cluster assembly accessory protein
MDRRKKSFTGLRINIIMIINVTDSAKTHIVNVLTNMDKPYLVFGLKGGGCAGFEYFWEPADQELYEKNGTPDRDEFIDLDGDKKLIIDCTSLVYLFGCTIDYKSDFISSNLFVENPNAKSSCGCGTSIAV